MENNAKLSTSSVMLYAYQTRDGLFGTIRSGGK